MDAVERLASILLDKMRVNVIIVAIIVWRIIDSFGGRLIHLLADQQVDPQLVITVIVGLIGTGVGGLIAAMIQMFQSPAGPCRRTRAYGQEFG